MKLKKNHLMMAGMFVVSFAVINVGMHFFLRLTQPKMAPRRTEVVAKMNPADSTKALAAGRDSTVKAATDTLAQIPPQNLAATSNATPEQPVAQSTATDTANAAARNAPADVAQAGTTDTTLEATDNTGDLAAIVEQPEDTRELGKLAKLLETMKPADAASIASRLDEDQIIALVMRMKDRTGGKMLAAMPVEQAARVATRMSQMASRTGG